MNSENYETEETRMNLLNFDAYDYISSENQSRNVIEICKKWDLGISIFYPKIDLETWRPGGLEA